MQFTKQTIEFTLGSLPPGAAAMTKSIMESSVKMFEDEGEVVSGMFAVKEGEDLDDSTFLCEDVMVNDETRPAVWAKLRDWRSRYPFVGFISEVWTKQFKKGEWKPGDTLPRPSECEDKKEMVLFNVFVGERVISFSAEISRNPSKLHPWVVTWDTAFPTKNGPDELGGAMMDKPGKVYPVNGN